MYVRVEQEHFAYSSNGDGFYEHDFLTGQERELALGDFPTPDELIARYYAQGNQGSAMTDAEKKVIQQPYYTSGNTYPPRYYQRNAINRTLDAIARGQQRLLLVMATGTGKTYTAFQIVYRLLKSGMKKKVLYLADRNILVDQSIQQDFAPLEKTIHKINFAKDKDASVICFENFADMLPEYLKYIMQSEMMKNQIKSNSDGTTVATLTMVRTVEYVLPLPPLAEQKRIVAKLEELLPLCERLK